jgi:hypothetical protein
VFTLETSTVVLFFVGGALFIGNYAGVPASTSMTAVGAIAGLGVASGELDWAVMGEIAVWWLVAPILGFWVSGIIDRYFYPTINRWVAIEESDFTIARRTLDTLDNDITDFPLTAAIVVAVVSSGIVTGLSVIGIPASFVIIATIPIVGLGWGRATRTTTVGEGVRGEEQPAVSVDALTAEEPGEEAPDIGEEDPDVGRVDDTHDRLTVGALVDDAARDSRVRDGEFIDRLTALGAVSHSRYLGRGATMFHDGPDESPSAAHEANSRSSAATASTPSAESIPRSVITPATSSAGVTSNVGFSASISRRPS